MTETESSPLDLLSLQLAELFAAGDYAAGFALGRHILLHAPRHLATYRQMGLAARQVGLFADCADLLPRALSADPEDGSMWAALRDALLKLEQPEAAEMADERARDLLPEDAPDTLLGRARAAARQGDWRKAYALFRQGYLAQPERLDAALGLAEALYHLREFEPVQTVAQTVLQELPFSLKAHLLLLLSDRQLEGDWIDVRRHQRIVQELDPTGAYSQRWFHADDLAGLFDPTVALPPWDATERWDYAL
jgi:tetratricopeptide (TPR) repeat protein